MCVDSSHAARSMDRFFGCGRAESEFYMVDLPLKDFERGVCRLQPYPVQLPSLVLQARLSDPKSQAYFVKHREPGTSLPNHGDLLGTSVFCYISLFQSPGVGFSPTRSPQLYTVPSFACEACCLLCIHRPPGGTGPEQDMSMRGRRLWGALATGTRSAATSCCSNPLLIFEH